MDTTANSLARIWQLLAENPDAQERLREEIKHAVETEGEGDTLDFDKLMELPYLDAVCRETLRVCVIARALCYYFILISDSCNRSPGVASLFRE